MSRIAVILVISFLFSCSSTKKTIPDFEYSHEELAKMKSDFYLSHYDILFFLMVNREGKVVSSRIIARKEDNIIRETAERFKRYTYKIEFTPANDNEANYRQFMYPMNVKSSFEWR